MRSLAYKKRLKSNYILFFKFAYLSADFAVLYSVTSFQIPIIGPVREVFIDSPVQINQSQLFGTSLPLELGLKQESFFQTALLSTNCVTQSLSELSLTKIQQILILKKSD